MKLKWVNNVLAVLIYFAVPFVLLAHSIFGLFRKKRRCRNCRFCEVVFNMDPFPVVKIIYTCNAVLTPGGDNRLCIDPKCCSFYKRKWWKFWG